MNFPEYLYSGHMEYTPKILKNVFWPLHFHRNMELIYVMDGCVCCNTTGQDILLQKDDFALFLPNEIHSYSTPEHSLSCVIVFSSDFIPYFINALKNMRADRIQFQCTAAVLAYFQQVLLTETPPDIFKIKSCLYGIISDYLKQVNLHVHKTDGPDLFIANVTDFVSQNYQNHISLNDMAKALSFNYSYLSRTFKKVFSINFNEFVNLYRVARATELLTEGDDKITEIAFASGFQSVRSFNAIFKKRTGLTPKEYRAQQSIF